MKRTQLLSVFVIFRTQRTVFCWPVVGEHLFFSPSASKWITYGNIIINIIIIIITCFSMEKITILFRYITNVIGAL